jgi:hypothetical protein
MWYKQWLQLAGLCLAILAGWYFISPWLGVGVIIGIAISVIVYVFGYGFINAVENEVAWHQRDRDSGEWDDQ